MTSKQAKYKAQSIKLSSMLQKTLQEIQIYNRRQVEHQKIAQQLYSNNSFLKNQIQRLNLKLNQRQKTQIFKNNPQEWKHLEVVNEAHNKKKNESISRLKQFHQKISELLVQVVQILHSVKDVSESTLIKISKQYHKYYNAYLKQQTEIINEVVDCQVLRLQRQKLINQNESLYETSKKLQSNNKNCQKLNKKYQQELQKYQAQNQRLKQLIIQIKTLQKKQNLSKKSGSQQIQSILKTFEVKTTQEKHENQNQIIKQLKEKVNQLQLENSTIKSIHQQTVRKIQLQNLDAESEQHHSLTKSRKRLNSHSHSHSQHSQNSPRNQWANKNQKLYEQIRLLNKKLLVSEQLQQKVVKQLNRLAECYKSCQQQKGTSQNQVYRLNEQMNLMIKNLQSKSDIIQQQKQTIIRKNNQIESLKQNIYLLQNQKQNIRFDCQAEINQIKMKLGQKNAYITKIQKELTKQNNRQQDIERHLNNQIQLNEQLQQKVTQLLNELSNTQRKTLELQNQIFQQSIRINQLINIKQDVTKSSQQSKNKLLKIIQKMQIQKKQTSQFVQVLQDENQKLKIQNQRNNKLLQKSDATVSLVKTKLNQLNNTWGIDNIQSLLESIRSNFKQNDQLVSNLKGNFKQQQNKFQQQQRNYLRQIERTKQRLEDIQKQKQFDFKNNQMQLQLWKLKICPQQKVASIFDILQIVSQKNQSLLLQQKQPNEQKSSKMKSPQKTKQYQMGYSLQQYKQLQAKLCQKVKQIIELQTLIKSKQNQNKKLKGDLMRQTTKVQQFQEQVQLFKRQLQKKDFQISTLNDQIFLKIEKACQKVKIQQKRIAQLQLLQQCDDLKIKFEQKLEYSKQQIQTLNQQLTKQQQQLQRSYSLIVEGLKQKINMLQQQILQKQLQFTTNIKQKNQQLNKSKNQQLNTMILSLNALQTQNQVLRQKNNQKQQQIFTLQTKLWQLNFVQTQIQQLKQQNQQLNHQIQQNKAKFQSQINIEIKKKEQIKQALLRTQQKLQFQQQNYKQLSEQTDKIKVQLRKIKNLQRERQKSRSKEREQEKMSRIKQRQTLKSALIGLEGQKQTLEQNIKFSEKYRMQLQQQKQIIQNFKKQINQLNKQNISLKQNIKALQLNQHDQNQYQVIKKQYSQIKKREQKNIKYIKRLKQQNLSYLQELQSFKQQQSKQLKKSNRTPQINKKISLEENQTKSPKNLLNKKTESNNSQKYQKTNNIQEALVVDKQLILKLKEDLKKSNQLLVHYQEQNELIGQKFNLTLQKQLQIEQRYNQIEMINKTVSQKLQEMRSMYEQSRSNVQYLQVQNRKLSSQLSSLKTIYEEDGDQILNQKNQKISELQDQIQVLNNQILKLREYEALGFEVSELKQILELNDVQIDQIVNLQQKLKLTIKQNRQNELTKTLRQKQLKEVQDQKQQKIQLLEKDLFQLKRQLKVLKQENDELKVFIKQNQQTAQHNIAENIESKKKVEEVMESIQKSQKQKQSYQKTIKMINKQNDELKLKLQKYKLQNNEQYSLFQLQFLSLEQKLKITQQKLKESESYLARFRQNQNIQHPIEITIHPVATPKNGQQFTKELLIQNQHLKQQIKKLNQSYSELQQKLKDLQKIKSIVQLQVDSEQISLSPNTPNTPNSNSNQEKQVFVKTQKHHSDKTNQKQTQNLFLTAQNIRKGQFLKQKQEQNKKSSSNSDKQQNRLHLKNTNISSLLIESNTNKKSEQLPLQIIKKQTQEFPTPEPTQIHPKTSVVDTLSHKLKNAQKIISLFKVQNQELNHQLQLQKVKSAVFQKQVKFKVQQLAKMKRIVEQISDQIQFQKKRNKNFQQLYQKYKITKKGTEEKSYPKKKVQGQKKQQKTELSKNNNQKKQINQKIQNLPLQIDKNKFGDNKIITQKSPRVRKVSGQKKVLKQSPLK